LTEAEIKSYYNHLSDFLYKLDTRSHYEAAGKPGSDAFLYVRCFVVASGQIYYEKVLHEPENIPDLLTWCEELLYTASTAWKDKGQTSFNRNCTEKRFETGSNPAFRIATDG
jgi:hypothetical protein